MSITAINHTGTKRDKGFRILIVDDDILIHKLYSVILKPPRYLVKTAENGRTGLEIAKEFKPDLIISDVIMPVMDGHEFCKALRSIPEFENTILLLSSSILTEAKDAVKALEGGADDYLLKPIEKDSARAKIDAFLRIKVLQDNLVDTNAKLAEMISELEKSKKIIAEKNQALEKEKAVIKSSLDEKSYLLGELEKSNIALANLNTKLEQNFNHMISILTQIIEYRRPENKGHAQKVAKLSLAIGERFDLPKEELENIQLAAFLHEIGKVGFPDTLFTKSPDDFSEHEKLLMKQYTVTGERLINEYSGLEKVARIIRHIKERVDGSGAPDHLAGNQIPLGSRILKAAIAFDDMVFDVKEEKDVSKVLQEIQGLSDTIFDSRVVHFLVEVVSSDLSLEVERMEKIYIADIQEGMVTAQDIFTKSGIKLIPGGTTINRNMIK
ncbi:MAG: response regulator, partial [FCB group bacterium]|nr:response regulator [FCB group bacterium]